MNYFAASREFCGGLTACLFFVVFRLAVKIFGGFAATSAKIGLAAIGYVMAVYPSALSWGGAYMSCVVSHRGIVVRTRALCIHSLALRMAVKSGA